MGHLDYASGTWIDDDSEPSPFQAGSIGEQTALPPPPPVPPPPPPDLSPVAEAYAAPPPPQPAVSPPTTIPDVQPAMPPPAPEVPPPGRVVSPAESANLASINENNAARGETVGQAGQANVAAATEQAKAADAAQAEQDAYVKLRQDITSAHAERLKAREAQQGADEQALRDEINAKPAPESFGHKLMAAIAIGLGQYAAIRTGTQNNALKIIEAAAEDKVAARKQSIEQRRLQAERSGKMTTELRAELDDELRRVNGEHGVILESTKLKLEKELGRLGVPQAQIAANADLQKLGAEALQKREEVLKGIRDDETALAKADIAAAARKKAAGTGGGSANTEASAKLAEYAQAHPGDTAGLYRLAGELKIPKPDKAVAAAVSQSKSTESQSKDAQYGAVALRAIDAIEQTGYKPSKAVIQKWIDNQRQVELAEKMSTGAVGAAAASIGQKTGLLAQSELDGIPDEAKPYFSNVRRYMESIGRKSSGAAISSTEWRNFFNQYGPNSDGGLAAARSYAQDTFKLSGVAGRQLDASGSVPKASETKKLSPSEKAGALKWLRDNPNDPRAAAVKKKLDDTLEL